LGAKHGERFAQHISESGRLCEKSLEFWKDRSVAVGLEVDLTPLDGSRQEPGRRQQFQLTLNRADCTARMARDLSQVVRLAWMTEQPAKNTTASASEQQCRRI
jgi:hypothetical protein